MQRTERIEPREGRMDFSQNDTEWNETRRKSETFLAFFYFLVFKPVDDTTEPSYS